MRLANRSIYSYLDGCHFFEGQSRMSKADQSLPRSLDIRTQRGPLMRLLVAIGVLMTLGGAANAASVQDEARQFFERFVAAQNAHDLPTVGSMLWNSEDFLWV